jgi:hypothetical protein
VNRQSGGSAAILYPTLDATAKEARIEVRFGFAGADRATVMQRPVLLTEIDRLISMPDAPAVRSERRRFATSLAFGESALAVEPAA